MSSIVEEKKQHTPKWAVDTATVIQVLDDCLTTKTADELMSKIDQINCNYTIGFYLKRASLGELNLNLKMMGIGVCPNVLGYRKLEALLYDDDEFYLMASERYEMTLLYYIDEYVNFDLKVILDPRVLSLIYAKIRLMHDVGIAHLDTHTQNFVLNVDRPITDTVHETPREEMVLQMLQDLKSMKIIDFGGSQPIDNSSELKVLSCDAFWKQLNLTSDSTLADYDLAMCHYMILHECKGRIKKVVALK
jgi:tRNA A-37 threonylcarbamoyl transferase component Bud32